MQSTPFFVFEAIFAWWRTNIQPTKQTTRWTKSKSALYRLEGMQSFAINVLRLDQPCIYNDLVLLKMSRCLYATQIVVIRRGWNRNWARKKRKKNYHSTSVLLFCCIFPWIMILLHPLVVLCCVRALSGGDLIRQSKDKQRHADKHCHIIHLPNILSTIVLIIHISHDSSILSTAFGIFFGIF